MSLFSKMKAHALTIALAATACTAGFALQSVPQAEAVPLAGAQQALKAEPTSLVLARTIRRPTGKRFIKGQNGRYKEIRVPIRRPIPRATPVTRVPKVTVRDHRVPTATVRDHRVPTATVRDHRK